MELTTTYILSQIFTIMAYAFYSSTFYCKNRANILILNFSGSFLSCIAYVFLDAWTGALMCLVSAVRNIIFLIDEKKNAKRDNINKKDIVLLIIFCIISIIFAIFTYNGFFSLFSVFATLLSVFSNCQKKVHVYKILGSQISILWIIYNIYEQSIFGIILEKVLLICSITGYILDRKK